MLSSRSSLSEWLTRLESFSPHEIELGLDRVKAVLERLALPKPNHVLLVGGTNGKGSSVAMLEAILLRQGASTGTYTSPHVVDFNERICIDGMPAPDNEIVAAFERVESARDGVPLTYFEYGTLAALAVFAAHDVDYVILEVGMGGKLDAVNAVEPDASLITNVSLDHCDWLGNDIETIAREKAGIMRPERPVIFASAQVPDSIVEIADELQADLRLARRDYDWTLTDDGRWNWSGRDCSLDALSPPGLRGEFQFGNAAGALALLEAAGLGERLDRDEVSDALAATSLMGRMQEIETDRHWLLDVAHNPAAAHVLAETVGSGGDDGTTVAIVAMLDDKDVESSSVLLDSVVDRWIAVTADSSRAIPAAELGRIIANVTNKGCLVADSLEEALDFARGLTKPDDRVLITGSFYLVGPALYILAGLGTDA
jgi:dihydrofolate synthase/folylpolyglutamate synthase